MLVAFGKWIGRVEFARYGNRGTAIVLINTASGQRLAVASTNLEMTPAPTPGPDQVWIKTWAENQGIDEALLDAGVANSAREVFLVNDYGSVAVLMNLTPAAIAERADQEKGELRWP